ncbi:MAG: HNH endonuclease [Coprothermobacterota bacterium]|nr:HNH endonuclease [Coprothermobacterota bacterium]
MPPRFQIKIFRDLGKLGDPPYLATPTVRSVPGAEIEDYIQRKSLSTGLLKLCRRNFWGKLIDPDDDLKGLIAEYKTEKQKIINQWRSYHKETSEPFMPRDWQAEHTSPDGAWVYRDRIVLVSGANVNGISIQEVILRIKHFFLKQEKLLTRMKKEVDAYQNMTAAAAARREPISEAVRLFVWQRDKGKCVKCGSKERLEFDHIIPIAKGGSSTERNVQLLCEKCNRAKSTNF